MGRMLPGPLTGSPPETDQATGAAPPPIRVAVNCSTELPPELAALQPVQLVSINPAPGAMEKVEFEGFAATRLPPQPARTSKTETARRATTRSGAEKLDRDRPGKVLQHESSGSMLPIDCLVESGMSRRNALSAFLGSGAGNWQVRQKYTPSTVSRADLASRLSICPRSYLTPGKHSLNMRKSKLAKGLFKLDRG